MLCKLLSEVRSFAKKVFLWCEDVIDLRLHFPNLKSVCEGNMDIDTKQFVIFLNGLKLEFETRFSDFDKVENVVQILNNCFSPKPNDEWGNEAAVVFKSNKAALQMELINFQEDIALRIIY